MDMPAAELTAMDRCDRCGAQARCVAKKYGKSDLLFCHHHKREHVNSLLAQGWAVHDDEALALA